jgi:hypothetical protein
MIKYATVNNISFKKNVFVCLHKIKELQRLEQRDHVSKHSKYVCILIILRWPNGHN